MAEYTPTPWRVNGNAIWSNDGYVAELSCPRGAEARDADAALIVKAVNAHDALVKALEQCAAPFSTRPGSVMQCAADIHHEFQRRMDIASEALRAAMGGSSNG